LINNDLFKNSKSVNFLPVYLVGGETAKRGNVYAINPVTGIDGPVCDDFWDLVDVS
jgi:hypothetical protein